MLWAGRHVHGMHVAKHGLPDQDTGVNLEEEESRMMARAERAAAPSAPMPADAPCMNEMPFRQKARALPASLSHAFTIFGALFFNLQRPTATWEGLGEAPLPKGSLQSFCGTCAPL